MRMNAMMSASLLTERADSWRLTAPVHAHAVQQGRMAVLLVIIFDGESGKLLGLARALEVGARAAGAEVELYRLEAAVVTSDAAATPAFGGIPVISTAELPSVLGRADGLMLGGSLAEWVVLAVF